MPLGVSTIARADLPQSLIDATEAREGEKCRAANASAGCTPRQILDLSPFNIMKIKRGWKASNAGITHTHAHAAVNKSPAFSFNFFVFLNFFAVKFVYIVVKILPTLSYNSGLIQFCNMHNACVRINDLLYISHLFLEGFFYRIKKPAG